jgi:SAM-dependent methyltransferase
MTSDEWALMRSKHPYVGEGMTKEDIGRNWDRLSKSYSDANYSEIKAEIVSDLLSMGALDGVSSLLDIGCGPGFFSMLLSEHVGRVVAMDASEGMLECLGRSVSEKGIGNIDTLCADWEGFDPGTTYDAVFTSLCPPTNDPGSILRMNRLSDRTCIYISSMGNDEAPHVRIWKRLGCDYSFKGYDTRYPCRFLREMGVEPVLKVYTQRNPVDLPYEEAFEAEMGRMLAYRERSEELEDAVAGVMEGMRTGDRVVYSGELRLGMLVWDRF